MSLQTSKSYMLASALADGHLSAEEAVDLARLETDFQVLPTLGLWIIVRAVRTRT